ncbi:S8 family serine peptidase [Aeromicrobium yanjiei]|uniref:S8 family serine peptidase n=1 Tax=Aeromicrobium yanjiei TaxID=2662028 RepID=A0A5Q2MLI4_9ACTN|nr:S8 family serine peptidase [Aeromicrobium yanjiei]QGG42553.1 S8 family serine peptidase [Aeromicrobium yanjiei]
MLSIRRSLTVAVVTSITVAGLSVDAYAADVPPPTVTSPKGGPGTEAEVPDLARGIIVETTTATPSDGLLAATDAALGDDAEVTEDDKLLANVSTVDFDEVVPADVAEDAAAQIAERNDVVWAAPNRLRQVQTAPPVSTNDQLFPAQHNLWNRGYTTSSSLGVPGNGGYSIKAPALWRATKGRAATVVAVIDTGIVDHRDLPASQRVPGTDTFSSIARDNDAKKGRDDDPTDPGDWYANGQCDFPGSSDSSWHGTFVAGQIAAATDNGAGIAAVAPNVKVQPIRALGRCGGWDSDIVDAMKWAAGIPLTGLRNNAYPAAVVNLSLAGSPGTAQQREAECRVYNAAARVGKARGTLYVAAAGNDGGNANRVTPASCSEFISVGATSINGFSAIYSNVGSTVDLSAPGGDTQVDPYRGNDPAKGDRIWSLGNSGTKGPVADTLVAYEGTSMASPQVAGAAALLHGLGLTTPAELTRALYASVSPFRARSGAYAKKAVGPDRYDLNCTAPGRQWCGRGRLDLSRVEAPLTPPVISGTPVVGEPLRASLGTWVRTPSAPRYTWKVAGVVKGTGSVYWPTLADVGRTITVTVAPSTAAFAKLSATSSASTAVPAGPAVTLRTPASQPRYGSAFTVAVSVASATGGRVRLLSDSGTTYGSGTVGPGGTASITVSAATARKLKPGSTSVRAAYDGDGTTPRASSPRRALTIKRLPAKVSTSLRTSVKTSSRATLKIRVLERPDLFASPTGELRVYDGKKRIRVTRLSSTGGGRKTLRLPKLKKGTHKIRVYFRDSDYIESTYSAVRTIRAR